MCIKIDELWHSDNQNNWFNALENYWNYVQTANLQLEQRLNALDIEIVQQMNGIEFYNFLHDEYYPWKYTPRNRLATTRRSLERYIIENRLGDLNIIKNDLFEFDREYVREGLSISKKIHGLGTAGASGLLAILFPDYFGTVDQFVVKALLDIPDLPEREIVLQMNPDDISELHGAILIMIMRRKANALNELFNTRFWTPRRIDMILWTYGRK